MTFCFRCWTSQHIPAMGLVFLTSHSGVYSSVIAYHPNLKSQLTRRLYSVRGFKNPRRERLIEKWSIMAGDTFELNETSIDDIQHAMKSGRYSARSITRLYLARIRSLDKHGPAINSVIRTQSRCSSQLLMNLTVSTDRMVLVVSFTAHRSCSKTAWIRRIEWVPRLGLLPWQGPLLRGRVWCNGCGRRAR